MTIKKFVLLIITVISIKLTGMELQLANKTVEQPTFRIPEFLQNKDPFWYAPIDWRIALFQFTKHFNLPFEITKKIGSEFLHPLSNLQIKKNLIFLCFYADFIKTSNVSLYPVGSCSYSNNCIELGPEGFVMFYPRSPAEGLGQEKTNIDKISMMHRKFLNHHGGSKVTTISRNAFFSEINQAEGPLIESIFTAIKEKSRDVSEYQKRPPSDDVTIDRVFEAETIEQISSILTWLPTVKSKQIEKILWSILLEKAGQFWLTILVNNQRYWDQTGKEIIDHFNPNSVNRYSLEPTSLILINPYTFRTIMASQINGDNICKMVIEKEVPATTEPDTVIFEKNGQFNCFSSEKAAPCYFINNHPHGYVWVQSLDQNK